MAVITQRLVIQLSKYQQICLYRLARAYQNKIAKKKCYFQNICSISSTVIYSFVGFL